MRTINIHNEYHLGDNIFTIHFLNKYVDTNISFNYYVNEPYINELLKHIKNKNINLLPLHPRPNDSYNMWIGDEDYYYNIIEKLDFKYDLFYVNFFKKTSEKLDLESKINSIEDMLFDNSNYQIDHPNGYNYLIINSVPFSKQFNYVEGDFIKLCDYFNDKGITFITTKKVKEYECTLDFDMSIVDIGNLSNKCENIIGVNTAPLITTFTKQNIGLVNKRFILDKTLTFSYNDRIIQINNVNDIYELI